MNKRGRLHGRQDQKAACVREHTLLYAIAKIPQIFRQSRLEALRPRTNGTRLVNEVTHFSIQPVGDEKLLTLPLSRVCHWPFEPTQSGEPWWIHLVLLKEGGVFGGRASGLESFQHWRASIGRVMEVGETCVEAPGRGG